MKVDDGRETSARSPQGSGGPLIYVMPAEAVHSGSGDEISLIELWSILWRGKWLILLITALFAVVSVAMALTATEWYRVEVLLAPADERSTAGASRLDGIGSLVSLAGISVGGGDNAEAIAVLTSRSFTRAFIQDSHLLPILFEDQWDAENGRWLAPEAAEQPDIRDGVRFFDENVRIVSEDKRTNLVTVSIEWTDPETAAAWANELVSRLNEYMRQRSLKDADANVAYLEGELMETSSATLRQSIGRLLETELQKVMLARGNKEFAFRVIDPAETPKFRSRPKRTLLVVIATAVGGTFSLCLVFGLHALRKSATAEIEAR